ncbi:DUF1345 domain-containing protein [Nocardia sp. NPDC005825]|uniref:DUF1345 domain-containing protein n=1 Tax=unclassified Nocardia TaxID=2637762 RepID=UPI0033FBEE5E
MRTLLWVLELVLTILGVGWLVQFVRTGHGAIPLLGWNVAAAAYMATAWVAMGRELTPAPADDMSEAIAPRWYTQFLAVLVSCIGLAAGLIVSANRDEVRGDPFLPGLAVVTILLSWLLLHSAFAQIYAREHTVDGGLDFPNCPHPQFTEYLYFAATIGTSFAVSDVTVTSRSMRRRVMTHSIVSFFFNAALIAIAIDWLKS